MENEVPASRGERMSRVSRLFLSGAVAAAVFATAPGFAGTVAGTGGSTEITQLMNNVELLKSAASQAETVRNTLQSAMYLKNSLAQLNPSEISAMTGMPIEQVRAMAAMQDQLGGLIVNERSLSDRIAAFGSSAQSQNMTPSEYLAAMSQQAQQRGGIYRESLDADQRQMASVHDQINTIQRTADGVPGVTSQVQGLQQLLSQNTQVQTQLVTLNATMTKANTMAAMEGKQRADREQAASNIILRDHAATQKLQDVRIEMPDPSQFSPGSAARQQP